MPEQALCNGAWNRQSAGPSEQRAMKHSDRDEGRDDPYNLSSGYLACTFFVDLQLVMNL